MKIKSVFDDSFAEFGTVLEGYDFAELIKLLEQTTEKPDDHVIYVPSDSAMEKLPVAVQLRDRFYGGMPIEVGYCNGYNTKLNCLEYHRDSEVDIAADDIVLLLARKQDFKDGRIDTSKVEAFSVPAGTGVQMYETAMHYAPARPNGSFRVVVVLPACTNLDKPAIEEKNFEDGLLRACNKWLIAHPDAPEAKGGAYVGITGANIDISE